MADKSNREQSCSPAYGETCCKVEAVISIDERGQMILPKEIRHKAGISAGDKLAVINWEKNGKSCCLTLMKAENLSKMAKDFLGPVLGDIA